MAAVVRFEPDDSVDIRGCWLSVTGVAVKATVGLATFLHAAVAISLAVIAVLMAVLSFTNREEAGILVTLAIVLSAIGGILFFFLRRADRAA